MAISPHTPPGTHVVAVLDGKGPILPLLRVGAVYVVTEIHKHDDWCRPQTEYGVCIAGVDHSRATYKIACFDYAVLPKCLTELQTKAPDPALLKEVERAH